MAPAEINELAPTNTTASKCFFIWLSYSLFIEGIIDDVFFDNAYRVWVRQQNSQNYPILTIFLNAVLFINKY